MTNIYRTSLALFLAIFFVLAVPVPAKAQVTSTDVEAIIQRITDLQIQILLAKISELQAQIAGLIAKQAETSQAVTNLGSQTVNSPTPVVTVAPTTVIIGTPACSLRHSSPAYQIEGYPVYESTVEVPLSVTGSWSQIILKYNRYPVTAHSKGVSYVLPDQPKQAETEVINTSTNEAWQTQPRFKIQNYPDTYDVTVSGSKIETSTQSVTVPAC